MRAASTVNFPQLEFVDVDTLEGSDVHRTVVGEEVRVGTLPAYGCAAGRTEGVHDSLQTELVRRHGVFAGDPFDIALERVDHEVAIDMADGAYSRQLGEEV